MYVCMGLFLWMMWAVRRYKRTLFFSVSRSKYKKKNT